MNLGVEMINNFTNQRHLEIAFLDSTYHGREVIEIIADLELIELFECPIADNVLSNFWKGPYEQSGNMLQESTNF